MKYNKIIIQNNKLKLEEIAQHFFMPFKQFFASFASLLGFSGLKKGYKVSKKERVKKAPFGKEKDVKAAFDTELRVFFA